jgi:hypothetical protein
VKFLLHGGDITDSAIISSCRRLLAQEFVEGRDAAVMTHLCKILSERPTILQQNEEIVELTTKAALSAGWLNIFARMTQNLGEAPGTKSVDLLRAFVKKNGWVPILTAYGFPILLIEGC